MCECGCSQFCGTHSFAGPKDTTYVIGVYPSCENCSTPAGVTIYKLGGGNELYKRSDFKELEFMDDYAVFAVISPEILKNKMAENMIGSTVDYTEEDEDECVTIDDITADCLVDNIYEVFKDSVCETQRVCGQC